MYRIAICDDDINFLEEIGQKVKEILRNNQLLLGKEFDVELFHDTKLLKQKLIKDNTYFHLLLLDIELSKENGIEFAKTLRNQHNTCSIIYISSYRDYVFDCFDTQPLWYLLKPIDYDKLKEIILHDYHNNYANTHLLLKIDSHQVVFPFASIYALESTQHRTRIWLEEGFRDWNGALSTVKAKLPSFGFSQSHNSYILNLRHIKEIRRTEALMDDGRTFPISRRYYDQILENYFSFLKM